VLRTQQQGNGKGLS